MSYYLPIKPPKNDKEGLINFVQMIVNEIETGNTREALLKAVDLVDSLMGCKFSWHNPNYKPVVDLEEPQEPVQVTQIVTHEETQKEIYHRNSYYI